MPRVGKKNTGSKQQPSAGITSEPWTDAVGGQHPLTHSQLDSHSAELRTPTQSPTRPHIGYFGRSSCPCWRCVRNMGPLQRRKEVVEQDVADILLDAWQARTAEGADISQSNHAESAKMIIDAADKQDIEMLENAFARLQAEHDEHTLGDVADRILIYTVQKGWDPACKLCVKYHADINAQDEDNGGTPLMYAIHNAHDVIVETLLQLGADMEHEEQQGYTPLMVACLSDNATACEMLLKNKATLDSTDSKGRTALSMACRYGSLECVKVLTSCGANVSHRDEDGMSVLEHAEQNDRRQVVGLIKRAQLANQMRQRRKQKSQHKENGMTMEEFLHREEKAKETMVELLQEIEKESECAESRKARQRAKRNAKKNEKKVAKRKDNALEVVPENTPKVEKQAHIGKASHASSKSVAGEPARCPSIAKRVDGTMNENAHAEERDRFGCTLQEAAELDAFRRVLLEGRVSPEEAVWQWCSDDSGDIRPEQLRKMWEFMVDAASQCRVPDKQRMFMNIVSVLLEVCQNHGISVKQGRKVKARLEKVAALRAELESAMRPPVNEGRLEAAIECARSVTSMLEEEMIACAQNIMAKLHAGGAEASVLLSCAPHDKVKANSSVGGLGSTGRQTVDRNSERSTNDSKSRPEQSMPNVVQNKRLPQGPHKSHFDSLEKRTSASSVRPSAQQPAGLQGNSHSQPVRTSSSTQGLHPPGLQRHGQPTTIRTHGPSSQPSQHTRELLAAAPTQHSLQPTPPAPAARSVQPHDPMMDLLGEDLVGVLDGGGSTSQPTWSNPGPLSPLTHRQPAVNQSSTAGMRPYGNVFRVGSTQSNTPSTTQPPPGPPPAPPPISSLVDGFGTPKAPNMHRNGLKRHAGSGHQASGHYPTMPNFSDPKLEPRVSSSSANGFSMGHRLPRDILSGQKDSARFALSMRAAPFLPASKAGGPQGMVHSATDAHTGKFQSKNGSDSSLPPRDDTLFGSSHGLPNDPFGLDSPTPIVGANDLQRLRRNATSDAVTSVLGGSGVSGKAQVNDTMSYNHSPSHMRADLPVQQDPGIVESLLGLSLFDALDGGAGS